MDELVGNPKYITNIETTPFISPDEFLPKSGGAQMKNLPAEIKIIFTKGNEIPINRFEFTNKKSNVKEYRIEVVKLDSSKKNEIFNVKNIFAPFYVQSDDAVKEIKITITATRDKKIPNKVEISVKACIPEVTSGVTIPTTEGSQSTQSVSSTGISVETTTEQTSPKGSFRKN